VHYFAEMFHAMDDPYLKARHEDILHLGNKLYNAWRGTHPGADSPPSHMPVILVGAQVSVSDIANVAPGMLAGIVCFEGSSLSHTSVLANAMGVPAVMGVAALKGLHSGELIVVDGNEAQIILHPTEVVAAEFRKLIDQEQAFRKQLDELRDLPAQTTDGVTIKMYANTGLLADISPGLRAGAEGVGLYRTEIPFMVRDSFPSEEEQTHVYERVFAAYVGKPVYMRTLDIGGDKHLPYFPITGEENPALGWRGIRFTLDNIQLLMTQVRAMIRAAGRDGDLHILLPMVTSTSEIDKIRQLIDDACEQLQKENLNLHKPKMGVMIEVPAAISQLPFWKHKIDFVSIGSNDLSQYLLALDRNNARVASRYDHVHPAVLHEVNRIVQIARDNNLPLSICGEMSSDPVAVALLLGMGVRSLSTSAARLPRIKWLIRSVSIVQCEALLRQALTIDSVGEIRRCVSSVLSELGLDELLDKRKL
jgi:phosphotransferase system enzyme I (PtsI)/phosphotransferase system enzyme I (PtsP)